MREYQKSYYEYYTEGNAVRKRVVEVPQQEPRKQELPSYAKVRKVKAN